MPLNRVFLAIWNSGLHIYSGKKEAKKSIQRVETLLLTILRMPMSEGVFVPKGQECILDLQVYNEAVVSAR
jgi:hypothetical protein